MIKCKTCGETEFFTVGCKECEELEKKCEIKDINEERIKEEVNEHEEMLCSLKVKEKRRE